MGSRLWTAYPSSSSLVVVERGPGVGSLATATGNIHTLLHQYGTVFQLMGS